MSLVLLIGLLIAPEDDVLKLGIGKPWYDQETTKPQNLEGILDYFAGSGRIGVPAGYAPFRVVFKDAATGKVVQYVVHAPGFETLLALNVGQRVKVDGKVLSKGEGDARRQELWIGTMQTLGAAPLNVFTELKPIARTNRFQPQAMQVGNDAGKLIIRNGKDAAKAIGLDSREPEADRRASEKLAEYFAVKSIDWKTQMVIYVGNVYQPRIRLTKIEITRIDVHEKGATIFWKSEEGLRQASPYVSDTILIPKVEGEITFKQEETKKAVGEKDIPRGNEKILPVIPGAPIK
ncbi:MAG TPA: hypothetical protein PLN21_10810 [Gemmatales bacterium]|nr:hypothetical protein [Gemmatales bacterium]